MASNQPDVINLMVSSFATAEGGKEGPTTGFDALADEVPRLHPVGGTELNCNSVHAPPGGNLN